jgi:hypothetical protein
MTEKRHGSIASQPAAAVERDDSFYVLKENEN